MPISVKEGPGYAVGDGVADDSAAFAAAIAGMGPAAEFRGDTLIVPKGVYFMGSDLHITRQMVLQGVSGGGGNGGAVLKFAPGKGIVVESPASGTDGGRGDFTVIETLDVLGQTPDGLLDPLGRPNLWQQNHLYNAGDLVHVPGENRWYFECIRAGTSGTGDPPGVTTDTTGMKSHDYWIPDTSHAWVPDSPVREGETVYVPGIWMTLFRCKQPGLTGSTPPTWITVVGAVTQDNNVQWVSVDATGYRIEDGPAGPVWAVRVAPGIWLRDRAILRDTYFQGFATAGIHIQADHDYAPPTNANGWRISKARIIFCGLGVYIAGQDSNAGLGEAVDVDTPGFPYNKSPVPEDGGAGIWDHSFLGNTWIGCQVAGGKGRPYVLDNPNAQNLLLGCYAELGSPPSHAALNSTVVGGDHGPGFDSATQATILIPGRCQVIGGYRSPNGVKLSADLQQLSGFVFPFQSEHEGNDYFHWMYDHLGPQGWWTFRLGPFRFTNIIGVSGAQAAEGYGHWRDFHGHFCGQTPVDQYFLGVTPESITSNRVRAGEFLPGDRFEVAGGFVASNGQRYVGQIVVKAGFRGPPWRSLQQYLAVDPASGVHADQVEPTTPNGFAYRCVVGGQSGLNEPPKWTTTIGQTVNELGTSIVWECIGPTPEYKFYGRIE